MRTLALLEPVCVPLGVAPRVRPVPEQLNQILDNLKAFGPKRLAILGGVGAFVIAAVITASIYLNKPTYETLYVGLDRSDVNQIGMVLGEACSIPGSGVVNASCETIADIDDPQVWK